METNQNPVQENPAQRLALELEQPAERLYDPAEAARIVQCLTDGYFDPEYILLFGKLVGGTPHSDAMAYDLLMVVRETPEYDWIQTKRILRYKVPYSCRKITYINLYIMTLSYVESNSTPFLFFAHAEGELLYCSDSYHFQRPKHPIDFAKAYADAKFHFDTFRTQGNELLEQAQDAFSESRNMRLAAQFSAQAMVYFYHTLYYVSRSGVRQPRSSHHARPDADAFHEVDACFRRHPYRKHLHAAASEEFSDEGSLWHSVRHRTAKVGDTYGARPQSGRDYRKPVRPAAGAI